MSLSPWNHSHETMLKNLQKSTCTALIGMNDREGFKRNFKMAKKILA